ncbi:hypothetical protein NDA13_003955 [Ustilago tritici]|nr:hypothetical protein NDA13_003955 [Ustilago tritici]
MFATITQPATTVPSTSTSTSASDSASASASTQSHTDPSAASTKPENAVQPPDISSPHQLIDWVDTVLGQLESRFDDMNGQVTSRNPPDIIVTPFDRDVLASGLLIEVRVDLLSYFAAILRVFKIASLVSEARMLGVTILSAV